MALTVKSVETLKPGTTRREVPDGLIRGLYLVVQPSGARSWAVRYRHAKTTRKLTLGSYPAIGLAKARELASKALVDVASNADPAAEKKRAKAVTVDTVESVIDRFIERHAKLKASRSWQESERILNREVKKGWAGRALRTITRAEVHELLDGIVDRGAPITANRTLAAFRKLCGWAVERGILETSPCAGIKAPATENSRDRVLDDHELATVWRAATKLDWPFGPLIKLLILTGQRREEVAGMRWSELDLENRTWTLPKGRAKNKVEHVVHLSKQAAAILADLPRINDTDLVFTTNGRTSVTGFSKAKDRLDDLIDAAAKQADPKAEPMPAWVVHDLRRSFASGCAGLGIALPVIERALNHVSGSFAGIVGVYQRHGFIAERKAAMDAWGRHIEAIFSGEKNNIVELKAVRS